MNGSAVFDYAVALSIRALRMIVYDEADRFCTSTAQDSPELVPFTHGPPDWRPRSLLRPCFIPVEIHSAIQDQGIHIHLIYLLHKIDLLHKKCGSRVRNQMICPVAKSQSSGTI